MKNGLNIVYAGDRDISINVLRFLLEQGIKPKALMVSDQKTATHDKQLISVCGHLENDKILRGNYFRTEDGIKILRDVQPDYIIGIHFPYLIPKEVLEIPKIGFLNLHPAYLPYNKGWHTPTWAIWEKTPYGATLHFMDEGIDTGDILLQKEVSISPNDTADSLYRKVKIVEFDVFKEAWPMILKGTYKRKKQVGLGTMHTKKDISRIQEIDMKDFVVAEDLIRKIRALTTNKKEESAYFKASDKIYRIRFENDG